MERAGEKLKRVRERLKLTFRDVEQASQEIAARRGSDEFSIALSRSSYAAGTYVFVVHNRGTTTHALGISGPGINSTTDCVKGPDTS